MSYFKNWKRRFMRYFILKRPTQNELPNMHQQIEWMNERDAQLMNSLYWPKGNTNSSSEPPPYEPNLLRWRQDTGWSWSETKRMP